jgi:hypothetical protein
MIQISIIPESIQIIDIEDDEYFGDDYKKYISNSRLSLINPEEGGSAELYLQNLKSPYSESFEFGTAIHAALLQKSKYEVSSITKPTGKLGLWAEHVYQNLTKGDSPEEAYEKASKSADYYSGKLANARLNTAIQSSKSFWEQREKLDESLSPKLLFLSSPMRDKYLQCMANINDTSCKILETICPTPLEGTVFEDSIQVFNEVTILCDLECVDEETGEIIILPFKAKLDNFTIDHELSVITLNDVKTTGKPINYFMGNNVKFTNEFGEEIDVWYHGSFQKYRYYRQLGIYSWLLQALAKYKYNLDYKMKVNVLVIESFPEFKNKIFPVNGSYLREGLKEFKNLMNLVMYVGREES